MSNNSGARRYVGFNERYFGRPSKPGNKQDAHGAAPPPVTTPAGPPRVFVQDSDFTLYVGDVRDCLRELPDQSVHTVVTSPPYWGLRDYSVEGQLGLEATPDEFVAAMVDVFREVRRVLRADGTLWLNLGDSYNTQQAGNKTPSGFSQTRPSRVSGNGDQETVKHGRSLIAGLKPKDLVGIPWRVAFALQADGWFLRSDIIWAKPNPMPESVTDRPTKAHEYVFLLSKSPRYFFDAEAVREPHKDFERGANGKRVGTIDERPEPGVRSGTMNSIDRDGAKREYNPAGRSVRSVWEIATQPYPDAHFATFPEALPERCIKAGSSERGCCPECGAPWERILSEERAPVGHGGRSHSSNRDSSRKDAGTGTMFARVGGTLGWRPSCGCWWDDENDDRHPWNPIPCTVLDPFMGSGTTALVARRLGRKSIGVELNPEYAALCARRLQQLSLLA